jgi:glycerol kinase
MRSCVLAIDQGTTGTTCLVVQHSAQGASVLGRGYAELPQVFAQPGLVEHDLESIWQSVCIAAQRAVKEAEITGPEIVAIGVTNQRETVCLWDRQGRPVHRAIVWQDRRTQAYCAELAAAGHGPLIAERTGLLLDPYFSATKLRWLLREVPGLRARALAGDLLFGTVDSWLLYRLTGGRVHATCRTNACRTLLYDIHRHTWDLQLCALFDDIPQQLLPRIHDNNARFGTTLGLDFVPDGVPISGVAGDQQAALVGQACLSPGLAKCTYGTGAFALVNTGPQCRQSHTGLLSTLAYSLDGQVTYALEGSVFVAGAVVQWLRDGLKMFSSSAEIEALALEVPDSGGVVVVPALVGLGAPHWKPQAKGLITGISRGTTRAHIARAALEGIAFQVYDLLAAMRQDSGASMLELRVDGGASANNLLMQFQADLLGIKTHRPRHVQSTALGAAHLAALGVGLYSGLEDIAGAWRKERTFEPLAAPSVVAGHLERWHSALEKV